MEAKEIIEVNKLIAEFMGGKLISFPNSEYKEVYEFETEITYFSGKKWPPSVLPYHSSWDWLMPVVCKIEEMDEYQKYIDATSGMFGKDDFINSKDITITWYNVLDFIEWYNQNKTI